MKIKERKIYVVGGCGTNYINWMEGIPTRKMEDADLVLFTGGEDVDPKMYGEPRHPFTSCHIDRDLEEKAEFQKALKLRKRIIGICRGSQFLCVMNGGRLIQHQENPYFYHPISTYDGKKFNITSTHHQAQYPWNLPDTKFKVLGWTRGISEFHENAGREEMLSHNSKECEIVYYPKTKSLGIQGHPEMMLKDSRTDSGETIGYLRNLLDKHMEGVL